jgi:hypothetical protein
MKHLRLPLSSIDQPIDQAIHQEDSTEPKLGWKVRQICVITLLLFSLSAPREARASSGKKFLETIGISTAMGTVLGASTLPFYDQPGKHLMNVAYGASAGAVVGVGVGLYQWLSGRSNRDQEIFGGETQSGRWSSDRVSPGQSYTQPLPISVHASSSSFSLAARDARGRTPVLVWAPLVSLTW